MRQDTTPQDHKICQDAQALHCPVLPTHIPQVSTSRGQGINILLPQDNKICQDAQVLRWLLQLTSRCLLDPSFWLSRVLGRAVFHSMLLGIFFLGAASPTTAASFPSPPIPGSPSCSTAAPPLRPAEYPLPRHTPAPGGRCLHPSTPCAARPLPRP
ncbi:hypothetical protein B0H11DRAFT_2147513 [Mycena galericulata]|nr:hypothetical protein B0H11DRAFT_2147513 [Mycena galericulata]